MPLPGLILWDEVVARLFQIVLRSAGQVAPGALDTGVITQARHVLQRSCSEALAPVVPRLLQRAESKQSPLEFTAVF